MIEKKTKIICTIGPSTWNVNIIRSMIEAGMNCARVNGAFADPEEIRMVTDLIKSVSNQVALMIDVKGTDIRLNKFKDPVSINTNDTIVIGSSSDEYIYVPEYPDLYKFVEIGQRIILGDGDVELIVDKVKQNKIFCRVIFGEIIKPGKAINLPGAKLPRSVLTQRDIQNLQSAIDLGWDYVSASFIRSADDVRYIKKYILDSNMKIIAKIEDQDGIDNIDEILPEVDGIMIARGGLGVELGFEKVPIVQRYLTNKSKELGKICITATQMLESMTYNIRPTRAEVNDVFNAVLLGTDAVMLSGETSSGKYPIETVHEMTKIILEAEKHVETSIIKTKIVDNVIVDSLSKSVAQLAISLESHIKAVILVTDCISTIGLITRHEFKQKIYVFVDTTNKVRYLSIVKNILKAYVLSNYSFYSRDKAVDLIKSKVLENEIANKEDNILLVWINKHNRSQQFQNIIEIIKL